MKSTFLFLAITLLLGVATFGQQLHFSGGHSHNDYNNERPLLDALGNGMVSIEADIFLQNGQLLVGHDLHELQQDRTLEKLYLQPLAELALDDQLQIDSIILLVDIKDDGEASYQALKKVIAPYHHLLSEVNNGQLIQRQVTIILSGDRPIETVQSEKQRFVFIDGRLNGTNLQASPLLIPLISDNWNNYFKWRGSGEISTDEQQKLREIIGNCHAQKKLIRFWGIPGEAPKSEKFWTLFLAEKVDLLGCDCPACLHNFIQKQTKKD